MIPPALCVLKNTMTTMHIMWMFCLNDAESPELGLIGLVGAVAVARMVHLSET